MRIEDELISLSLSLLTRDEYRLIVSRVCKTDAKKKQAWELFNSKKNYIEKESKDVRVSKVRY